MTDHVSILVSSQDEQRGQALADALAGAGHTCSVVGDPLDAIGQARTGDQDIVIAVLDDEEPENGMAVLRAARRGNAGCQVIVIARPGSGPADAVAAMREGALYYMHARPGPVEVAAIVDRAIERVMLERDRDSMQAQLVQRYGFDNITARSPAMLKVLRKVAQVARTRATVLVYGETGTGKELIARALHFNSSRRNSRFVPLNCAGLVETLLESELFGHAKGAFTGAAAARVGLFEHAHGGSLFMDEIGDMPLSSQSKLLRVLEQGEIIRVGSNDPIAVDVRLIAATHRDLLAMVEEGTFRRDLFYRLNVVTINLPPLRERQGDVPLLLAQFLRDFSQMHERTVRGMSAGARAALFRHDWPGNVRELRNCIEHMVVSATEEILTEADLPDYLSEHVDRSGDGGAVMAGRPLEEVEKQHIARTLELVDGNRERAAELLGIGERTLYRKILKYDLR
jgi:two-component system, NtrC family, response regulator HydG